jgi:hypothetical protein
MFPKEQLQLSYRELTQKVVLWVCEDVSTTEVNQHTRRANYIHHGVCQIQQFLKQYTTGVHKFSKNLVAPSKFLVPHG